MHLFFFLISIFYLFIYLIYHIIFKLDYLTDTCYILCLDFFNTSEIMSPELGKKYDGHKITQQQTLRFHNL